jgi:hypothetical protein
MSINPSTKISKLVVAGIVVVVVICLAAISMHRAAQIEKATQLVDATAKLFDKDEDFQQNAVLSPDPWNRPLRIEIESNDLVATCTVTSAGPDKTFDTDDDISKTNRNIHADAEAVGERVGKTAGKFGIGLGKGMAKAVKEKIQKKE